MTKTPHATPVGPYPDAAQVADAVRRLARHAGCYGHGYPYTCGVLGAAIRYLADLHAGCRQPHCDTCWHLRAGLAAAAAIEHQETR